MATKNNNNGYNFEILAHALSAHHQTGNGRALNERLAGEYGVPAVQFKIYDKLMDELYNAACDYEEARKDALGDGKAIKDTRKALKDAWSDLLKCGSTENQKLKPREDDYGEIASYASKFVNSGVNFDMVKGWSCAKTTANTTPQAFRKSVETMLGIRIDETPRLSDDERDYYQDAQAAVSKCRNAQSTVDDLHNQIEQRKAELETVTDEPVRQYIQKIIDNLTESHEKAVENLKVAHESLALIRSESASDHVQRIKAERDKKKEQRRAKRDEKRAEKKAAKEAEKAAQAASAPEKAKSGKSKTSKKEAKKASATCDNKKETPAA